MKRITVMLIISALLMNMLGVAANTTNILNESSKMDKEYISINCNQKYITSIDNNYLSIEIEGISTFLSHPGEPRLPKIVETIELPFGVKDINVESEPISYQIKNIDYEIEPSNALVPLSVYEYDCDFSVSIKNIEIYSSSDLYPNRWFDFKVTCGLNSENKPVTFLTINFYPIQYRPANYELNIAEDALFQITYNKPDKDYFPEIAEYDLVIIAPQVFSNALQPLVDHKNNHNVKTLLKTTEEIYSEYTGVDKPEQIKYFIKDAKETLGITYVMLVGGLKSVIYSKPKDDFNQGTKGWYLPVRYTNLYDDPAFPLASSINDPGTISDLYYADLYEEGGEFSSWDPNGDGVFAAWDKPGFEDDVNLDFTPDVCLGRLACTSIDEVNTLVNKIITYESGPADSSWFKKMIIVSGDGFLDQTDLNIQWDTSQVETGEYTIFAQSRNPEDETGPIEEIKITVDHSQETILTFNHDDHLRTSGYPGVPIAEIVTVSEGDILGSNDFFYSPAEGEAYCNEFYNWANMSYINKVLTIRGKSYDPKPYGIISSIHVWIENSDDEIVFSEWRNNTEMYYEGECTTGYEEFLGRGGALYYMPEDYESEIIWASNGRLQGPDDIIDAVDEGAGFLFFSGHGSPNVWTDQLPGIPGNRGNGGIPGLRVTTLRPYAPFFSFPLFPLDTMSNGDKLPIAVVGGCHNSQFNVSMVMGLLDAAYIFLPSFPKFSMWCYGTPVPETFSWRIVRNPNGGAIASMGNTGLGYGMPGIECTTGGGDSWITIEFFKQYGSEGHDILGQAYAQTLTSYVNTFDMTDLPAGHPKTIEQWVLLGDPSLKIGGYPE